MRGSEACCGGPVVILSYVVVISSCILSASRGYTSFALSSGVQFCSSENLSPRALTGKQKPPITRAYLYNVGQNFFEILQAHPRTIREPKTQSGGHFQERKDIATLSQVFMYFCLDTEVPRNQELRNSLAELPRSNFHKPRNSLHVFVDVPF